MPAFPMPLPPQRSPRRRRIAWIGVLLASLMPTVSARAAAPVGRKGALPPTISASWTGTPLREVCRAIGALVGRPVILDRRIDPGILITVDAHDTAPADVLGRIATAAGCSVAILPASIRLLPASVADAVVEADGERAAALGRLPAPRRNIALGRRPLAWPDGARPRDLLATLAEESGGELFHLDAIPHDHLAAADLPAMTLADRLDLLLADFDLRIDWRRAKEEDGLWIVPLPAVRAPSGRLVVAAAGVAPPAARPAGPSKERPEGRPAAGATWSLEVAAPLEQLLATVATRMDLELELDREGLRSLGIAPAEIVRLAVKNVGRDELLDRIVAPLGLAWSIEGRTLRVGPPSR